MNFLFGFLTKKPKTFRQRFVILFIVLSYTCMPIGFQAEVSAAEGVKLTDEQLDAVYAEGFFFDVQVACGKIENMVNSAINANQTSPSGIVHSINDKANELIKQPLSPAAVMTPESPENNIFQVSVPLSGLPPQITQKAVAASQQVPAVDLPQTSMLVPVMNGTVVPETSLPATGPAQALNDQQYNPVMNTVLEQTAGGGIQPVVPDVLLANEANAMNSPEQTYPQQSAANNIEALNVTSQSVNSQTNNQASSGVEIGAGDLAEPVVQAGGNPSLEVPLTIVAEANNASQAALNSGINMVIIDDAAQQYLSSFVNVNAAGSIVPVLINITININSSIQNLSNVNQLDLSSYSSFNIH